MDRATVESTFSAVLAYSLVHFSPDGCFVILQGTSFKEPLYAYKGAGVKVLSVDSVMLMS